MRTTEISIWFFNGVLLTIYGAMILGYGLYEAIRGFTAPVVLSHLHAPIWWGATMLTVGIFYLIRFYPERKA